ncbi:MAG: phosphocholine cytidylyltransferase family protein, partial [Tumebacillaceae bacterium]
MMKQAMILAAGRGKRLGVLTEDQPKPLTQVNGITMLDNAVQHLIDAGYDRLTVVIGYEGEQIRQALDAYRGKIDLCFIENPQWATTNNIYSLYLARNELRGEVTLLEGDIFFDASVLAALDAQQAGRSYLAVSPLNSLMEGAFVQTGEAGEVTGFYSTKDGSHHSAEQAWKTVNLYRLSADLSAFLQEALERKIQAGDTDLYYELLFRDALENGHGFQAVEVPTAAWVEIDNAYDMVLGEYQFSEHKHDQLKGQYGGYWRYPITDFTLIYNFHFPPQELKTKMIERFDHIMLNYPANPRLFTG